MKISISSVIISLFLAIILIGILQIIIKSKSSSKVIRTDFLFIICVLIFFRLIFPFEFSNTKVISSKIILPYLYEFGRYKPFIHVNASINIFTIFFSIWILGALVKLTFFILEIIKNKHSINRIIHSDKCKLVTFVDDDGLNHSFYRFKFYQSPFVTALIKPKIFLPEYITDYQTQKDIIHHEIQHIKHHDLFKKLFIEILVCIYWWFPPVYLFQKQVNLILEMVIDQKVTESLNRSDYFQYIDELIVISKFSQKEDDTKLNTNNNLMSGFLLNEQSFLKNRIQFLLNEFQYKHTSKILLSLTLILPLLLTSTIVEPDYATPEKIKSTNRVHL